MALPLMAAAAGIGLLGKIGTGIFQGRKANQLERDNPFVKEEMAPELLQNLADAEMRKNQGLAAPAYNQAEQNIKGGTSTYLRAFGQTGRAGSLLSAIRNQNDSLLNLDVANAKAIDQNRATFRQQNGIVAGERARLWNANVRQPYERVQQRISNLRAGSNANIGGTFTDAAQLGAMMAPGFGGSSMSAPGQGILPDLPRYNPYAGGAKMQLGAPAGFNF